jgi:putative heme-binding domain-containing protein
VLALAQHPDGEGVLAALEQLATAERTRAGVIDALVESHTRLDRAKLVAVLEKIGARLVQGRSPESVDMAVRLVGAFELRGLDSDLVALVKNGSRREGNGAINIEPFEARALSALAAAGADQPELFSELLQKAVDPAVIGSAAAGLAASRSEAVVTRMLGDWGKFSGDVRRIILGRLLSRREGAVMLLSAIERGAVPKTAVDAGTYDRLQAVLGANNADLSRVLGEHAALFRPVLVLDGTDEAGVDVQLSLLGALTIESWLMLEPGISNADGLIGTPGLFDINFYGGQARLYGGGQVNDVIVAKSPMVPKVWTHVAFTRNDAGDWKIYIDGEPQPVESKRFAKPLTVSRIGWSTAKGGFAGALDEFRVWNRERSPAEIRAAYDRILAIGQPGTDGLIYAGGRTGGWGKLRAGAAIQRTADFPPLLSEEEAAVADKRYARFRALAEKSGNIEQGKALAATCRACHLFRGEGNSIGPDLSGVGAMGVDGILRNVLMPNAAMENAYRIYRAELRSGELIEAMLIDEDAQGLTLRIPGAPDRRVPKTELREGKFLRRSLMPEGLLDGFTESQITDLFTYLMSLK